MLQIHLQISLQNLKCVFIIEIKKIQCYYFLLRLWANSALTRNVLRLQWRYCQINYNNSWKCSQKTQLSIVPSAFVRKNLSQNAFLIIEIIYNQAQGILFEMEANLWVIFITLCTIVPKSEMNHRTGCYLFQFPCNEETSFWTSLSRLTIKSNKCALWPIYKCMGVVLLSTN